MSTEINITVEGGNLSDVAWSNQWQNRQNEEQRRQQEKEAKRKAAEEAEQKKLEEQKKAAGSGTSNKYRPDEPAANRRPGFPNVLYAGATGITYSTQTLPDGTRDRKATWQIYPFTNSGNDGQPYEETLTMANLPGQTSGNRVVISTTTSGPTPTNLSTPGSVVSLLNDQPSQYPWTITEVSETYWHALFSEETQADLVFPSKTAVFSAYGLGWFWYTIKRVRTRTDVYDAINITDSSYYITGTSSATEVFTSSSGYGQDIKAWNWTASPANAMLSFPSYADNSQVKEIECPASAKSIITQQYLPEYSGFRYTTASAYVQDTTSYSWDGESIATVVPIYTNGALLTTSVTPAWDYRAPTRPVFFSGIPYYRSVGNRAITPGIYSVFTGTALPTAMFKYYLLSETVPGSSPVAYRWRLSKNGSTPIGSPRTKDEYISIGSSQPAWDGGMEAYCTQQLTSLGFITTTPAS